MKGCRLRDPTWLQYLYVYGLGPFWACLDLKSDSLAFLEPFESGSVDARVVNEKILTIILLNKTIALLVTEPLHSSFCHSAPLLSKIFYAVRITALAEKKDY
jgi:hypothetical protein